MLKDDLRKKYKSIRNNIVNKELKDDIIFTNLINEIHYKQTNIIACYLSFNNEVDTYKIIKYSILNNKKIVIPKIKGDDLIFTYFDGDYLKLIKNKYGIYETKDKEKIIDNSLIDLIIVPSICCNTFKYRIGYGKGYYDRYLKNKKMIKTSLCYDELIDDTFFQDENDVMMDFIITDKRIIN